MIVCVDIDKKTAFIQAFKNLEGPQKLEIKGPNLGSWKLVRALKI